MKYILRPLYLAYVVLSFLLCLLALFPVFWVLNQLSPAKARQSTWFLVRQWARAWLWAIGMAVKISGPFPGPSRYVYIAPHRSYLDTLNIYAAIPQLFRPLGKEEVGRIPLLGPIYRQLVITVDRGRSESRARSLIQLQNILEKESSIMLFPEGGFQGTGQRLSPFFDGAFRLALRTGTPIQPILFPDVDKRWNQRAWWSLWPGRNRVVFLEPIPVTDRDPKDIKGLKADCYQIMERAMAAYSPPELA